MAQVLKNLEGGGHLPPNGIRWPKYYITGLGLAYVTSASSYEVPVLSHPSKPKKTLLVNDTTKPLSEKFRQKMTSIKPRLILRVLLYLFGRLVVNYFASNAKRQPLITILFYLDPFLVYAITHTLGSSIGFNDPNMVYIGWEEYQRTGAACYPQWLLFLATWAFGYIGPHGNTFRWHLAVAIVRVVVCLATAGFVYYFQLFGYDRNFILMFLVAMLIPATVHLVPTGARYYQSEVDRARELVNSRNSDINLVTGFRMRYLSLQDRMMRRAAAMDTVVKNEEPADEFFYHPILPLLKPPGRSKLFRLKTRLKIWRRWLFPSRTEDGPQLTEMSEGLLETQRTNSRLFSRCYCCIGTDKAPNPCREHDGIYDLDNEERDQFLSLPSLGHSEVPKSLMEAHAAGLEEEEIKYHSLCRICTNICRESRLLTFHRGPSLGGLWQIILLAFRSHDLVEEAFSLPSAREIQSSAKNGCHLCNMIWDLLSPEQQSDLLQRGEDTNYVKILTQYAHRKWAKLWLESHVADSLRLIPHFGARTVPRRWMTGKRAEMAKALGDDPVMEWHKEHVEPIEIRVTGEL